MNASDLTPPPRLAGDGEPWPVAFYGERREAWRDALAAIDALGDATRRSQGTAAAPSLQWQLTLDDEGRVVRSQPLERSAGARGPGKARPVSLATREEGSPPGPARRRGGALHRPQRYSAPELGIDVAAAAMALIDHPGLVFDDAPEQAVALREALPLLEVLRERQDGGEHFVFHLADPLLPQSPFRSADALESIEASATRARAPRKPAHRARRRRPRAADAHHAGAAARGRTGGQALGGAGGSAQPSWTRRCVCWPGTSSWPAMPRPGTRCASDARLRAELSPQGDGLQLRLLAAPFGDFGPRLAPGSGRDAADHGAPGPDAVHRRDLAPSARTCAAVLDALDFLDDERPRPAGCWTNPSRRWPLVERAAAAAGAWSASTGPRASRCA